MAQQRFWAMLAFIFIISCSFALANDMLPYGIEKNTSADNLRLLDSSLEHPIAHRIRERPFHPVDSILVGGFPAPNTNSRGLTFCGTYLWLADDVGFIYKLDPATGAVLNSWSSPGGGAGGMTWDGAYLWHGDYLNGQVYKYDTTSMTIIKQFGAPGAGMMFDLAFDGQYLYGALGNDGYILGFDTSGVTVDSIHATYSSGNVRPFGLAYLSSGAGELWTSDGNYGSEMMNIWDFGTSAWVDQWSTSPAAYPCGIAYDPVSGLMWVSCWTKDSIYIFDVGPQAPPEAILFVDDDAGASYETYWETSFGNLSYPFDKWVVADSADIAPDSADMGNYTIVVWTTGVDYSTSLTPTDSTELGKWLAAGGKLWLSSQDVLYDLGPISWMHLGGFNSDVGCDSCAGIGPVMNGTAFYTTGGAFTDYSDNLISDGVSWAEVLRDYADTNSVAIDTSAGEPYFVFFNAFGWENINTEANRDTMMERILTWMGYATPSTDAAAQSINWPGTSVLINANDFPTATFRNAGAAPITFDVHFEIDTSGINIYTGAVQSIYLDVGVGTTWVFTPDWTAGPVEGIVYDVTAYTVMPGDDDPSNDTLIQTTVTTAVSNWIQCANRPTPELCHASCYDPVGDYIYALGGGDGTNYVNWTYRYDPVNDSWASLAAMPTAINWIDASVTQWNRSIYVFGGYNGGFNNYNYIYDIVGDSWSSGASMPSARIAAGQCVYNDSLVYMLCGHTGSGGSNSVYIYNTYTDAWTTGTNAPTTSYMMAVATTGDTLWLVMTYNGSTCNPTMYYGIPDPANCENITWSTGPALPTPNFNGGGTSLYRPSGKYVYEVGGFENATTITAHAYEYDVNNDAWNALPDYPMTICRNDVLTYRRTATEAEIFVNGGDNSSGWTPTAEAWKLSWAIQGVEEEKSTPALVFGLSKITPNPVADGATIAYTTIKKGPVSLKIYDISGRLVRTLVDRSEDSGQKMVRWDGKDTYHRAVSAGVYFYRLTAEDKTVSEKMVVVK